MAKNNERIKFVEQQEPRNYSGFIGGYADPLWGEKKGEGQMWYSLARAGRTKEFNQFLLKPANQSGGRGVGDILAFDQMSQIPTRMAEPESNPRNISTERWLPYLSPYGNMVNIDPRAGEDTRNANHRTMNPSIKRT